MSNARSPAAAAGGIRPLRSNRFSRTHTTPVSVRAAPALAVADGAPAGASTRVGRRKLHTRRAYAHASDIPAKNGNSQQKLRSFSGAQGILNAMSERPKDPGGEPAERPSQLVEPAERPSQLVEPADRPRQLHRPSRLRRAVAASGIVGALGVGSLTGASFLFGDAPSRDAGTILAAGMNPSYGVSGPTVTRGSGLFDVISGGS